MKKLIFLCCILSLLALASGCGLSQKDLDNAYSDGWLAGYDEGHETATSEYWEQFYHEEWDLQYVQGYNDGYENGYNTGYIRSKHSLPYYIEFETNEEYEEDWAQYEALFDPDTWEYLYEDELK